MGNGKTMYENLKADINDLLSVNWFVAKNLAKGETGNGSAVGDTYLATLTTVLENSLTAPNSATALFVGARGSGVLHKTGGNLDREKQLPYSYYGLPDDPLYSNGMYWVTGPEGLENNGKGTQFYSNVGSDWSTVTAQKTYNSGSNIYGFVNWQTWPVSGVTRTQPDNSGPFLTVGYGTQNQWDDIAMAGGYGGDQSAWAKGFVQEKNLANSSLKINSGTGEVKLQGDIGKSKALDTVSIESNNAVTVGTDNNNVTDYYHGTIYVDHGLYISGNGVKVGGEIHSGESEETDTFTTLEDKYKDNVTILSSGNIEVHGITSNTYAANDGTTTPRGGKIKLTSTGTEGTITLGDGVDYNGENTNGGVLKAASTANDAVVIDAQGKKSKFVNETTSTKAIDTQGRWKIYSASPEQNTFGKKKNLNSGTDAQWTSTSTKFAANGSDENKFIFQTTPTITLYVKDQVKTYGDDVTEKLPGYMMNREEFTGVDGKLHNVNEFTDAFQEKTYDNYISVPEGQGITVTSVGKDRADGAVGTATRTGGNHTATEKSGADGKNAVYDLNVNLNGATAKNGYVLKNENATLEIVKRKASITGTGTQTYGDTDGTIKNWKDTQTNIAKGSTVTYDTSVKSDSAYTNNQKGRNTADYGTYGDSVSFDKLKITDANENEVNIADNYDLTTTGTIAVGKAKLTLKVGDTETTYGTAFDPNTYTYTLSGNTNGDSEDDVRNNKNNKIEVSYSNGGEKSDPTNSDVKTQNVGDYNLIGTFTLKGDTANNYEIDEVNSDLTGKATVKPKDVYFYVTGNGKTIGDVVYTVTDTNPNPDYPLNPNDPINSQLVYGETVTPSYTPDGRLPNGHYGVSTSLPGYGPIESGKVYGNYRYHYDGDVTLTTPSKPDIVPPVNPPVTPGTGTVTPLPETPENTSNTPENTTETTGHKTVWDGERDRGGDRPEDKRVVTLPFFKVLEDKTTHRYGTYDVAKRTTEVKIEPSAQVLPEPNQPATQYRELTTELTTDKGTGEFTLKYNGSRFTILPDDDAAMKLIVVGDETKNRALFEKALHVAFTQMGLEVADLDGVYIHFGKD